MSLHSKLLLSVLMMGTAALGGCGVDAEENPASPDGTENIATTEQAIYQGWTAYTSDGYAPASCDGGSLVSAFQCSGRYCDDTRLYCQPAGGARGNTYWTSFFSEEGSNYRDCGNGYWITGLACNGSYCDNVSLQCSYMGNFSRKNCYWTGWMSEENGGLQTFGVGYFAVGAQCGGRYCDNKRYLVCQR